MDATWIERDDGTHVLLQPMRSSILAEIVPDRNTYKIYVLNKMRMTFAPIGNVDNAKSISLELIRKTIGEVLVSIADEPTIPRPVAVVPYTDCTVDFTYGDGSVKRYDPFHTDGN